MDEEREDTSAGLAQPDRQKKCPALVRIGTRKHRSASPPELRGAPIQTRTGGAVEGRGTFCEIKGFTEQNVPLPSAVPTAPGLSAGACQCRRRQCGTQEKRQEKGPGFLRALLFQ